MPIPLSCSEDPLQSLSASAFRRNSFADCWSVWALVVLADLLVVSHYVIRTGEVWELAAFRTEAMSAREQTAAFSTAVDDLKKRLGAMNEVNQRLRVMLGIEVPKTGDMANGERWRRGTDFRRRRHDSRSEASQRLHRVPQGRYPTAIRNILPLGA